MTTVIKRRADAPAGFFEAEAAGLAWLASAGMPTAPVIRVEPGLIELERIVEVTPTAREAQLFGERLARMHAAGAASFGAPPDGWDGPLFIGDRRMPVADEATWGRFYARDRVLPFLEAARRAGTVTTAEARDVTSACDRIGAGEFDDGDGPARIHGDLWSGNVLWSKDGVRLIDPAAHGGHRETDLAMLALFGCPHLSQIQEGYQSVTPLRAGWRRRVPLHQLHPLAVHAAGHGRSYGLALHEAALAVLDL